MTADALRFITAVPFKTLSRHPVVTDLYDEEEGWQPTHIKLADEADLLLIAPATANTIAKLALGLANDALSCIALALNPRARILVAPAMNGKMWLHPATQQNVATLKSRGVEFIGPEEGPALLRIRGPGPAVAGGESCRTRAGAAAASANPGSGGADRLSPTCMNVGLWQRLRHYSLGELALAALRFPGRAVELLKIPAPDAAKLMDRIATMERDIILPIKVAGIAMLLYSFYFKRPWIGDKELGTLEIAVEATQYFFVGLYCA